MKDISVVVPVYGCSGTLNELSERLEETFRKINLTFEIIFVVDRSPDNSWEIVQTICSNNENVKGILLSRNFGQHTAIITGLNNCCGEWIIVMDCDLQDKPEEIEKLYKKALEDNQVVFALRNNRKDTLFKKIGSKMFYSVLSYLTGVEQDSRIANFGIFNKKVIDQVIKMGDNKKFFPSQVKWVGFKTAKVEVEHLERKDGKTSYSLLKLLNLAIDVILLNSDKPLRLMANVGLLVSLFAFGYGILSVFRYFRGEVGVLGWTSLIFSIWFLSGIVIFFLGIIGLYIGKIFESVKNRPEFIIDKKVNL